MSNDLRNFQSEGGVITRPSKALQKARARRAKFEGRHAWGIGKDVWIDGTRYMIEGRETFEHMLEASGAGTARGKWAQKAMAAGYVYRLSLREADKFGGFNRWAWAKEDRGDGATFPPQA